MRTIQRTCRGTCNVTQPQTDHLVIGLIPEDILENTVGHSWIKAAVCVECGSIYEMEITEDELNRAERRYISALVESDNMSLDDARDILGLE